MKAAVSAYWITAFAGDEITAFAGDDRCVRVMTGVRRDDKCVLG